MRPKDLATRFLDNSRICLVNNAAERALRGIALNLKSWLVADSDHGGEPPGNIPAHRDRKGQQHRSARLAR